MITFIFELSTFSVILHEVGVVSLIGWGKWLSGVESEISFKIKNLLSILKENEFLFLLFWILLSSISVPKLLYSAND